MANQVLNDDNDIIENVVDASWQKGACPPEWVYNLVANTPLNADTEMGDFN